MIEQPYETLATTGYQTGKIVLDLEKSLILNGENGFIHLDTRNAGGIAAVLMTPAVDSNIKPFGHPIMVTNAHGYKAFVADARPMFSLQASGEVTPKGSMTLALQWIKTRLLLQTIWSDDAARYMLKNNLDYPQFVFGKVFSEALTRRYSLEPMATARVDILLNYMFWCNSHTKEEYDELGNQVIAHAITTTINSDTSAVLEVIGELDYLYSLNDLLKALQEENVVGTLRMHGINLAIMAEVANTVWRMDAVARSTEIAVMSLEHVPTWVACVFNTVSSTFVKNNISQVAQRYSRQMNSKSFITGMLHIVVGD